MMLKRIVFTFVSALLAILVFEPFAWRPLALVAWFPFFFALKGATDRTAFYLGLFHGLVLFGVTLSWMWNIFGEVSIALWAMLALFTAITSLLIVKVPKGKPVQVAILAAVIWTGVEFFRAEVFALTFPWITPGTGLPPNWMTPVVGVYGVTFVIILGNAFLLSRWKYGVAILAALGVAVVAFTEASRSGETIRVGLVQDESAMLENLKALSEPLLAEVDAVVWPEYALGDIDERDLAVANEMAGEDRVFVASGSESRDGVEGNTAITFAGGEVVGRHIKNHPVHFFSDGVAGEVAEPVETRFGKAGTPICFDCDHQDVVRKMTANGAEFFLIPSLDAIHWSARQHEQHGVLFRHRAAENGRWLAVASSSGVTQIIDPRGHVRNRLPLMDEGALVGEISASNHRTLFQWSGWLIGPASTILTGGVILWLGWRRFSKSS